MELKFKGRCYECRAPLDPSVHVYSKFEFQQVLAWSNLTNINIISNDCMYKFLGPHKVVRMCLDCFAFKPKISLGGLVSRETGSKLRIDVPPRKTWNDVEILHWYKEMKNCPLSWSELPPELKKYPVYGLIIKGF